MVEIEILACELEDAGIPVTLEGLGGEHIFADHGDVLATSAVLPLFVSALCEAWGRLTEPQRAVEFLTLAIKKNARPLAFAETLDVLMAHPDVCTAVGPEFSAALLARAARREGSFEASFAVRALGGALRLALSGITRKHSVLGALAEISDAEDPLFAEPACRLIGVAFEQWRDPDLTEVLQRLLRIDEASSDAAFELGLAALITAFEEPDQALALESLRSARRWMARAIASGEERTDAEIFAGTIDLILGFSTKSEAAVLQKRAKELRSTLALRRGWLSRTHQGWLAPRADAELKWVRAADHLAGTAAAISRASWPDPMASLIYVVDAYLAMRCVRLAVWEPKDGRTLAIVIAPRLDDAFVQVAGLRQHLIDLVARLPDAQQATARAIIQRIGYTPELPHASDSSRWPLLERLGVHFSPDAVKPEVLDHIEASLANREAERTWDADPVLDQMLDLVRDELSPCEDFQGAVADQFMDLVSRTLKFLKSRQDAGPSSFGGRAAYLFAWGKNPDDAPLEAELAADYHQFLESAGSSVGLASEVRDRGGGRVDVLVHYGTHSFTAELKREFQNATPDALRYYLGQAGSYQGTGVRLGILLVLDLTQKLSYVPHLRSNAWVDVAPALTPGDLPRYVVVARVPGNRRVPSDTLNPFGAKPS